MIMIILMEMKTFPDEFWPTETTERPGGLNNKQINQKDVVLYSEKRCLNSVFKRTMAPLDNNERGKKLCSVLVKAGNLIKKKAQKKK